jgi:hypothetical protein
VTLERPLRVTAILLLVVSGLGLALSGDASSMLALFAVWLLFFLTGSVAMATMRRPRPEIAGVWSVASLAVAALLVVVRWAFGVPPAWPASALGVLLVAIPALHVVQLAILTLGVRARRRQRAPLPRARVVA